MKLNIEEFKKFVKKATLNHSIDSIKMNLTKDRITSRMIKQLSKDAICILDIPNTILEDINDEYEFNFFEPAVNVIPYLNLIDDEFIDIKIKEDKIIFNNSYQKSKIHFCEPDIPSVFNVEKPKNEEPFITVDIDENFLLCFQKIKKIGNKFGKIYFGVDDNSFFIETTDRNNKFSNNLKFDLIEADAPDLVMCFDYTNMVNLFNILDPKSDYEILFTYLEDKDLGMLHLQNKDESYNEHYYLMSMM